MRLRVAVYAVPTRANSGGLIRAVSNAVEVGAAAGSRATGAATRVAETGEAAIKSALEALGQARTPEERRKLVSAIGGGADAGGDAPHCWGCWRRRMTRSAGRRFRC